MMMVIFGAGASYDSVPLRPPSKYNRTALPSRPPLADELFLDTGFFAASLREFPKCLPIVPYLQTHDPEVTIERRLEVLQAEGESDPQRKRQIAAVRYYPHFMIAECEREWYGVAEGVTNYVTLLDQLRRCRGNNPVLLATFNYDRLIENALGSVDIGMTDISDYIRHDSFKLFKLHGSTHWARDVAEPTITDVKDRNVWTIANELIERAPELKISDDYRVINERPIGKFDETPLFPALAIPVETKRVFECPTEHLDCLCEHLPKVTKILIVGWRGTEEHFLQLLKTHLSNKVHIQVVVAEHKEAEQVLLRIQDAGIQCAPMPTDLQFSAYVIKREAEQFFRK
jgi:hypothetical protein